VIVSRLHLAAEVLLLGGIIVRQGSICQPQLGRNSRRISLADAVCDGAVTLCFPLLL
jgi:hypothetical protein